MMVFTIAFHTLILFFVAFAIWRRQDKSIKPFFWPGLLLKVTAGILLGLTYMYYYPGGDTFIFFRDSRQLSILFATDKLACLKFLWNGDESHPVWSLLSEIQPRSLFFTKIVSIINLMTDNNYWLTGAYLSVISFLGSWYLIKRTLELLPDSKWVAMFSFLFFPSVVFWSSGMIKESMAVASLFFLSGLFLRWVSRTKPLTIEWIMLPLSLWILLMLKYYWAAVFIPAAFTTFIVHRLALTINISRYIVQILIWVALFLVICSGAMVIHPNFYPQYFLHVIVENNEMFNVLSSPQGLIHFYNLMPAWTSIIINSPWALCSGLLRPFPFEATNVISLLYSFENVVIMLLLVTSVGRIINMNISSFRLIGFAIIMYAGILCIFLALSTPNFGTLARYRIGFLPFLIFVLSYKNPFFNNVVTRIRRFNPSSILNGGNRD